MNGAPTFTRTKCPDCGLYELTYNGNYYCTNFDCYWALPDRYTSKVAEQTDELFEAMYEELMHRRDQGTWK